VSDPREIVSSFLEAELGRADASAIIKIELVYQPIGDYRREVLRTWHVSDARDEYAFKGTNPAHRDRLAGTILELAEQRADTEGGGGRKQFRIVLHPGQGDRITSAFAILPSYGGQDAELAREDIQPTPTGVLSQVMAQNHDLHKMGMKQTQAVQSLLAGAATLMQALSKGQAEQNQRMWDRIRDLEEQRAGSIKLLEDAKTLEHERMLEAKVVEASEARKDDAIEVLKDIGKAFAGSIGKSKLEVVKEENLDELPVKDLILRFMGSLSSEQRNELIAGLPMDLKMGLAEIPKLANAGDEDKLFAFLAEFFAKLGEDQAAVDLIESALTGRQRKVFDAIYERVRQRAAKAVNS